MTKGQLQDIEDGHDLKLGDKHRQRCRTKRWEGNLNVRNDESGRQTNQGLISGRNGKIRVSRSDCLRQESFLTTEARRKTGRAAHEVSSPAGKLTGRSPRSKAARVKLGEECVELYLS